MIALAQKLNLLPREADETEAAFTAKAWSEALTNLTQTDAIAAVTDCSIHPRQGWLRPADVIDAHRRLERTRREQLANEIDATSDRHLAHCDQRGCRCTHTNGCYKGWIELRDGQTKPCFNCREDALVRVSDVPPPGKRNGSDLALLRGERSRSEAPS